MSKALLIIDMQKGSFIPESPRYDTEGVCERINLVGQFFRAQDWTVIHVQHDGSKEDVFLAGSPAWEIIDQIDVNAQDLNIQKTANDAFLNSSLDINLKERGINELWISGCASDFCVNATVLSALAKNYQVKVLSDCHTTADRLNLKGKDVIALFNYIWAGLSPTEGTVEVVNSESLIPITVKLA